MRLKWRKAPLFLITFILVTIYSNSNILASEFNFSVQTVIPNNQIDKTLSYFNLLMEPGQQQILEIILRNDTVKDVVVVPKIASATTNSNGVVEYEPRDITPDTTLLYNMAELITIVDEITIPAKSHVVLELDVKMPEDMFEGILAGGITFEEKIEDVVESEDELDLNMSIKNLFAYTVAIILLNEESDVNPELTLNHVFPDQINKRNVIKANIQNITPVFVNQLKVDAKITKQGGSKVLYESIGESFQMAPNSNMDFPIRLDGEPLKAGDYTLEMTASSKGETWQWKKDFTIENDEAEAFNAVDVTIQNNNYWIYIGIGLGTVTLSLIIWSLFIQKKKKS